MIVKIRKIILLIFIFSLSQVNSFNSVTSVEASPPVTIVYDSEVHFGSQFSLLTALTEYIGHFSSDCNLLSIDNWRPGMLANMETVVYVGLRDVELPNGLLQEIASAKRVIWFERNIEQLARQLQWLDFKSDGLQSGWMYLNYNKHSYYDWINLWSTRPGDCARIIATAKNVAIEKPLAWQRDNVYYSGILEFNGSYDNFSGDLLHSFFPEHKCQTVPMAFLRIEDVSPLINTKNLQAVLDKANSYNIPFAIGVIPVGISGDRIVYLHENEELVAVLQEAQAHGASIIMHGYTHQNEYSPTTGEGYEFWNARDDKPMDNEIAFTCDRIEAGIDELVRVGLLPVAFEAPHYAAGQKTYQTLSKYFNIYSGEVQISDRTAAITMSLPYITRSKYLDGMTVIPENMGFYDGSALRIVEMLDESRELLNVPGCLACFFYHGYLPPNKLGEIISGMQQQGYKFLDLRTMPIKVQAPGINIYSEDGKVIANIDQALQDSWQQEHHGQGSIADKVISVQLLILFIIMAGLLLIIVKLQRNTKKHYENNGE